jgi:signal peptidase I
MDLDRDDPAPATAPLPVESNLRLVQRFLVGLALGLAMAQQSYLSSYRIPGNSMTPAFLDGDRVVMAKSAGFLGEPHCGGRSSRRSTARS